MTTALSSSDAIHRSPDSGCPGDDRLRIAALKLLRSSGFAALRRLRCEVTEAVVIVHGVVPSYYLKQMAQAVILRLNGIRSVMNLVEVRETKTVAIEPFTKDRGDGV
jgi:BON domain